MLKPHHELLPLTSARSSDRRAAVRGLRSRGLRALGLAGALALTSVTAAAQDWMPTSGVGRVDPIPGVTLRPGQRPTPPGPLTTPQQPRRGNNGGGPGNLLTDSDNDGLDDSVETAGWDIVFDEHGYGPGGLFELLTVISVSSSPFSDDTDGDGIGDLEEYLIGTHPNLADTDGDGLTDYDEWNVWFTSPNSVDSDSDARGPDGNQPPNAFLFDGIELNLAPGIAYGDLPRTSPTLADTDGDGMTDFEEIDHPFFHPLIADLPRSGIEIVGEPTIRLNVEYAENVGQSTEYGSTLGSSTSSTTSNTWGSSSEQKVGIAVETGGTATFAPDPGMSVTTTITASAEFAWSQSHDLSQEATQETNESYSEYQTDSLDLTETSATGFISVPVRLRNTGLFSFTLTSLGMTALKWRAPQTDPGQSDPTVTLPGSFEALATLTPDFGDVTLFPGETTPILMVAADDVNADVIKEYMQNPSSLVLSPAIFNLVTADGVDFDFITENTYTQTASVEISYGPGDFEVHRVATNVERNGFDYPGISLADALEQILGISYDPAGLPGGASPDTYTLQEVVAYPVVGAPIPTGALAISSIRGRAFVPGPTPQDPPSSFWAITGNNLQTRSFTEAEDGFDLEYASFDDVVLRAGDVVKIYFTQDADLDGLFAFEEQFFGTSDQDDDSDGDGRTDREEVKVGVEVGAGQSVLAPFGYPKLVYTSPVLEDSDGDGVRDDVEIAAGTDPTFFDTDRDGISDLDDLNPLLPAARFYVTVTGGTYDPMDPLSGLSWNNALSLSSALDTATALNLNRDPTDDVGFIWVERGTYSTGSELTSFYLPPNCAVLGGFRGDETQAGERDTNPNTNQTILSGELGSFVDKTDNVQHVVWVRNDPHDPGQEHTYTLDGFAVLNGYAVDSGFLEGAGIWTDNSGAHVVLRNLLFQQNDAVYGGAVFLGNKSTLIERCTFQSNLATVEGGAIATFEPEADDSLLTIRDCVFRTNTAVGSGGALMNKEFSHLVVEGSLFEDNFAQGSGGAWLTRSGGRFVNSEFVGNKAGLDETTNTEGGGAIHVMQTASGHALDPVSLAGCFLSGNRGGYAGALSIWRPLSAADARLVQLTNCTVVDNRSAYLSLSNQPAYTIGLAPCLLWASGSGGIMQRGDLLATQPATGGVPAFTNEFLLTNNVLYGNRNGATGQVDPPGVPSFCQQIPDFLGFASPHKDGIWAQFRDQSGYFPPDGVPTVTEVGEEVNVANYNSWNWPDAALFQNNVIEWRNEYMSPDLGADQFQGNLLGITNELPRSTTLDEAGVAFLSPANGDYRLADGSSLIDAGLSVIDTDVTTLEFDPLPSVDVIGNPRIVAGDGSGQNATVDIGAYEDQGPGDG